MRETLAKLVEIPSVSGVEYQITRYITEISDMPGCEVFRVGGRNVIVRIRGDDSTKAFLLNGHIDTVPSSELWQHPSFMLTTADDDEDKLIGLGVSDMKSGIAIIHEIAKEASENKPPCDLFMLYASEEETTSDGSLRIAKWLSENVSHQYKQMEGIILEPTDAQYVGVGHRGDAIWEVTASGEGGHAAREFTSRQTAIEKLSHFLVALPSVREDWKQNYSDPLVGPPGINSVGISGGEAKNIVPQNAYATLNLRLTPQILPTLPDIKAGLEDIYGITIQQQGDPRPTVCSPNADIYRTMQAVMPSADFRAFQGVTDMPAFDEYDMPMLIYGPGSSDAMHKPNEWVWYSNMQTCKAMVEKAIKYYAS